jgi:SRSO17 transposase
MRRPWAVQQPHRFLSASPWTTEPPAAELVRAADRLVGARDAVSVVDDTALVKQGAHPIGVQRQYRGAPGKKANPDVRLRCLRAWLRDRRRSRGARLCVAVAQRRRQGR